MSVAKTAVRATRRTINTILLTGAIVMLMFIAFVTIVWNILT